MLLLTLDGINIKHRKEYWRNTLCSKTLGLALQGSAVKSKAMEETRGLKKIKMGSLSAHSGTTEKRKFNTH